MSAAPAEHEALQAKLLAINLLEGVLWAQLDTDVSPLRRQDVYGLLQDVKLQRETLHARARQTTPAERRWWLWRRS